MDCRRSWTDYPAVRALSQQSDCSMVQRPRVGLQELAWASFALLRNTNTAGVLIWTSDAVLLARGEWRSAASDNSPAEGLELDRLGEARLMHCIDLQMVPSSSFGVSMSDVPSFVSRHKMHSNATSSQWR